MTDILFTEEAIFTACASGSIKCWLRPAVAETLLAESLAEEVQTQQQQQRAPV